MEAVAKLKNVPTSPRKMRLVADMVRGQMVDKALGILQFTPRAGAPLLHKLLVSAVSNWKQTNVGASLDVSGLYVKTIFVDEGKSLKRLRPAPQGRAYRVKKRSNHVTLVVDSMSTPQENSVNTNVSEN